MWEFVVGALVMMFGTVVGSAIRQVNSKKEDQ